MSAWATWKKRFWNAIDARIRRVIREERCLHQADRMLTAVAPVGKTTNIVERSLIYQSHAELCVCRHCDTVFWTKAQG